MPNPEADSETRMHPTFIGRANRRARRAAQRLAGRFARDTDGATAVEFGIVAILFFTLIFAVLELALVFFTNSVMSHAVAEAGRTIRVGQFQQCGKQDEFRDLVCSRMKGLMDCKANLRIDVISSPTFQSVIMPEIDGGGLGEPMVDEDGNPLEDEDGNPMVDEDGNPLPRTEVENGAYNDNFAGSPVVVRGTFHYPLILPPALTRLETVPGTGRRILIATTAFRNEPFPDGASGGCDPELSDELGLSDETEAGGT